MGMTQSMLFWLTKKMMKGDGFDSKEEAEAEYNKKLKETETKDTKKKTKIDINKKGVLSPILKRKQALKDIIDSSDFD